MLLQKVLRKIIYIFQLILSNLYNSCFQLFSHDFKTKSFGETINKSVKENLADWENNEIELEKNLAKLNKKSFLRWNVIQKSMFLNNHQICKEEFDYLRQSSYWNPIWKKNLQILHLETHFGVSIE